ncbi:hypothetical protein DPMN_147011 [Dreissena polymorpha]|uniref:Uncharacterized protein n=1 Tax=Dreissena polymorpha TaxID=45954 RepID=A0A9D4F9Q6_DREPO|nr:hypothetical protein DPMN_147011 [Dreissena polymorpha]
MSEINFIVDWIELDELESEIENPDPSSGSTAIVECQMPEIIELSANEIKELFETELNPFDNVNQPMEAQINHEISQQQPEH